MKIAIYQGASPEGDVEYAIKIVEMAVRSASVAGVKMIVFPELFLPGYNQPELHKSIAQSVCGEWDKKLAQISKKYSCGLTLGWAEQDEDRIFNSVSSFDEHGRKVCHYRKIQLFGEVEKSTFKCGDAYQLFTLNGYKTAVLICYDVEFAHHVQTLKDKGVELLLVPTANPAAYNNVPDYIVPARAAESGITIAYANYCGEEAGLRYGGRSLIVGPDGAALAKAGQGEVLLIANLDAIELIDKNLLSTQNVDKRLIIK